MSKYGKHSCLSWHDRQVAEKNISGDSADPDMSANLGRPNSELVTVTGRRLTGLPSLRPAGSLLAYYQKWMNYMMNLTNTYKLTIFPGAQSLNFFIYIKY